MSNSGERRISPGSTIYEGQYWLVEHAYPSQLKGWLVIVLKRHAEALHELSKDEFVELATIQSMAIQLLYRTLNCEKEYIACYAELEHFRHIHFHIVAKPFDLPSDLKGAKSFALLKVDESNAIPTSEIYQFCEVLRSQFNQWC